MRNTVFFLVVITISLFACDIALANNGTYRGQLVPTTRIEANNVQSGQYRFVLDYSNDSEMDVFILVDDVLVDIIGNYATDPNPAHREQLVNIPFAGNLSFDCVHISGNGGAFSIGYNRVGNVSNYATIHGLTFVGRLEGNSNQFVVLDIPPGTYDISCAFDKGDNDVDWTLYQGKKVLRIETGTSNPDIENGVSISESGKYSFNVRNLQDTPVNFTISLKPGLISTGSFSNNVLSGKLQANGEFEINIPLAKGTYQTILSFDQGDNDVDWTLFEGNVQIAAEFGINNPDIEDEVVITNTGQYKLLVRNLRDNVVNYRLEFKKIR